MKISLRCQPFPSLEDIGDFAPTPDSALAKVFESLTAVLSSHPEVAAIKPLLNPSDYPSIEFPAAQEAMTIEVFLAGNREAMTFLELNDPENTIGAFVIHAEPFGSGELMFADAFRVVVCCDEAAFLEFVRQERTQERDPSDNRYDATYLRGLLTTLTHEIAHAVEFISHAHGLTPHQAELWMGEGSLEMDFLDLTTGRALRADMSDDAFCDDEVAVDYMEDRVEAIGRRWLDECLYDKFADEAHHQSLLSAFDHCLQWIDRSMANGPQLGLAQHRQSTDRP